jgi:flagellar hook-associated protein 3 FlgL
MRVTESRMMEVSARQAATAQSRVAEAGNDVSTGVRVHKPSDDVAAWAEAERAQIRSDASTARGSAIGRARSQLESSDGALATISSALVRGRELATQMANGTLDAGQRSAAAVEVAALRDTVLSATNQMDSDGNHLFAGSQGTTAPFSLAGYTGDSVTRKLQIAEGQAASVRLSGIALTAAAGGGGVSVIDTLTNLSNALAANNTGAIQSALADLAAATKQVSTARSDVGAQMTTLDSANDARATFEDTLSKQESDAIGADPNAAASKLANARNALAATQSVAQLIAQITQQK